MPNHDTQITGKNYWKEDSIIFVSREGL